MMICAQVWSIDNPSVDARNSGKNKWARKTITPQEVGAISGWIQAALILIGLVAVIVLAAFLFRILVYGG